MSRWWELDALHDRYAESIDRHEPVRERATGRDGSRTFADYVRLLTDWRRLPYADPGLPLDLLPADWNGARAADLFAELHSRLADPAHDHAMGLIEP